MPKSPSKKLKVIKKNAGYDEGIDSSNKPMEVLPAQKLYRRISTRRNLLNHAHSKDILLLTYQMHLALRHKISNRWYRLKIYKNSVKGSYVITWLRDFAIRKQQEESFDVTALVDEEAMFLGNEIIKLGYIECISSKGDTKQHWFEVNEKKLLFFHFCDKLMQNDLKSLSLIVNQDEQNKTILSSSTDNSSKDEVFVRRGSSLGQSDASDAASESTLLKNNINNHNMNSDNKDDEIKNLKEEIHDLQYELYYETKQNQVYCQNSIFLFQGITIILICIIAQTLSKSTYKDEKILPNQIILIFIGCLSQIITFQICLHVYNKYYYDYSKDKSLEVAELDKSVQDENEIGTRERIPKRNSIFDRTTSLLRQSFTTMSMSRITMTDPIENDPDNLLSMRTQESLPSTSEWTNFPIFLCANNTTSNKIMTIPKYQSGPCPLSVPIHFESDIFQGKAFIRLKDVPSENGPTDERYFHGRTRRFLTRVQGRFKVPNISISEVYTGHEFTSPFGRLPPSWILKAGTSLIRTLAPGADIDLNSDTPKILSLLAGTSQVIRVDEPGNEPDIEKELDIEEDCSLLGHEFKNGTATISRRKKLLSDPDVASKYMFDINYVYTFDFFQSAIDFSDYTLHLGFTKIDLCKSLNGQPGRITIETFISPS